MSYCNLTKAIAFSLAAALSACALTGCAGPASGSIAPSSAKSSASAADDMEADMFSSSVQAETSSTHAFAEGEYGFSSALDTISVDYRFDEGGVVRAEWDAPSRDAALPVAYPQDTGCVLYYGKLDTIDGIPDHPDAANLALEYADAFAFALDLGPFDLHAQDAVAANVENEIIGGYDMVKTEGEVIATDIDGKSLNLPFVAFSTVVAGGTSYSSPSEGDTLFYVAAIADPDKPADGEKTEDALRKAASSLRFVEK